MVAPHAINTENPSAVAEALTAIFVVAGADDIIPRIQKAVADVGKMFEQGWTGYQPIDMEYHDLDHTLQVTMCMVYLLKGRSERFIQPELGVDDWELAILSALLHDTGFLKETGDNTGTGAKYTFVHEKRSCNFASKYLSATGMSASKIEDICCAISCTGPRNRIADVTFQREEARQIALLLVTADYLAQMSAADYLEKLPRLYMEFVEAFEHENVPPEQRPYQSLEQLLGMTAGFWENFVQPLLEGETEGVYHYLSPEGMPNPYLIAIEDNLTELECRLQANTA
ncbi:MAG: HD domain-containing protein [Akkermansiaceae bacterium]|jgi:hypothetical protein|nr:HD domain-containing protein [Akkermansiaceae bacterium]MDP4647256.1 HD domain-containing protein [Akkermansiaceae bacterium]MDP4722518.1 HD domain-containing protein [Akkermansiaceae bacterium]MDP4898725.1 HD domain-containing protein [Akkermansiaceae bacterium]MDP4996721.1 HD domain-containing protein [Akkermansiaceae bacterium]